MSKHAPGLIESTHHTWWLSTVDGRYHALWSSEIADRTKRSYSAMCAHTAECGDWTDRTGVPQSPICDQCLTLASEIPYPCQGISAQPATGFENVVLLYRGDHRQRGGYGHQVDPTEDYGNSGTH